MRKILILYYLGAIMVVSSCTKEEPIQISEDIGVQELFSPQEDELPKVKEIYKTYDLWLRLQFKDATEVTHSVIAQDNYNRYGVSPIDEDMKPSAIMFVDTLLGNVPKDFVRKEFPKEFFFVKSYNAPWWMIDILALSRNRLIVCWPNQKEGTQPITRPELHYYQDSVLTRMVWSSLSGMLFQRIEKPIPQLENAGTAYDKGKNYYDIVKKYPEGELRDTEHRKLAEEGGFISALGSINYQSDAGEWLNLLVTESYENINKNYLDNNPKRAAKYKIFTEYFKKEYNWDIQATGNKYRKMLSMLN